MSAKEAITQFAALFDAVRRLADIDDVEAAEQEAKARLNKAKDELEHYLVQRDRQAHERNAEAEAELIKRTNEAETAIHKERSALEADTADEHRKIHLAQERLKTEREAWARGQAAREESIARLGEQIGRRRQEFAELQQAWGELKDQVAAEQRKLEDTRAALAQLKASLAA